MIPDSAGCGRRLYRKVQPLIEAATRKHKSQADRYRKHFRAQSHIWVLILHLAHGEDSLRQTHAQLGANRTLRQRLGMPGWISLSQLARSSTSRHPDCFESLLQTLTDLARRKAALRKDGEWQALNRTKAIDSTFVKLSAKLSPWSKHGGYRAGVRVQWSVELASMIPIPELLCMHGADQNDHDALWELVEGDPSRFAGWTLILDLGYYGHRQMERLLAVGGHFLSKLNAQAAYREIEEIEEIEERPVNQREGWTLGEDEVLGDRIIELGSANPTTGGEQC